uniref:Evasin n=1 Tax=Rhipicephalus appendiculatus TaxID=34631 RepID=A0A131YHW9_RHIAP
MAFKACITIIAAVYAVQILCGADENSVYTTTETLDEDFDYSSSCMYPVMHIANNDSLAINCTMECGSYLNDSMPCVNMTSPPLDYNRTSTNYTCTVGSCNNGTCPSKNETVPCWI